MLPNISNNCKKRNNNLNPDANSSSQNSLLCSLLLNSLNSKKKKKKLRIKSKSLMYFDSLFLNFTKQFCRFLLQFLISFTENALVVRIDNTFSISRLDDAGNYYLASLRPSIIRLGKFVCKIQKRIYKK